MNSFAHALPYLDQPYVALGSFAPDLLSGADRKCRARKKRALMWIEDPQSEVAEVAQGVVRHHEDDGWFHRTAAFNNLNVQLAVEYREQFERGHSMRPSLIGHIVIEMMLDHFLAQQLPGSLDRFYSVVASVDGELVEQAVNRFATRPTRRLAPAIEFFKSEKYLYDYDTDDGVRYRLNRVLERVKLKPMPEATVGWLSGVRKRVAAAAESLLPEFGVRW